MDACKGITEKSTYAFEVWFSLVQYETPTNVFKLVKASYKL